MCLLLLRREQRGLMPSNLSYAFSHHSTTAPTRGKASTKLHTFGVCTGTPFFDYSREFRVFVSTVPGSERALDPGVDVVLEVVRMAVNEQFVPHVDAYVVPLYNGNGCEAVRLVE